MLPLLGQLRAQLGLALLFITHDLGVVASVAERVLVLERGELVETGDTLTVLALPGTQLHATPPRAAPSLPDALTVSTNPSNTRLNMESNSTQSRVAIEDIRRVELITATLRVISARGFERTTVRDIARPRAHRWGASTITSKARTSSSRRRRGNGRSVSRAGPRGGRG